MSVFCLHTNIPSPYRHHFFRMVCREFPGTLVVYTDNMHGDRVWKDSTARQDYPSCHIPRRVFVPKTGYLHLGLIPLILRQPQRVIHLMGACGGGSYYLLRALGRRRGGVLVEWNDGGFADHISVRAKRIWQCVFAPAVSAAYAPGRIGREYCRALGVPENRIFNSYFSHDVDEFDHRRRRFGLEYRKNIRARLGIALEDFVILNVSRFLNWKRLEDLHEALCRVEIQTKGDCHLILIGDGHHQGPLRFMQRDLSRIKLHWVRAVDYNDMPYFYAAADLLAFTSEGDIWGLVVNEALSMGIPVVCTNRIGASEMVREGADGFVVPPRRADLVAERILRLYHDRKLHGAMCEHATEISQRWNSHLAIAELHRMAAFLDTLP
jgi:glycosyltransferase involved in cell wall biosynthesis